MARLKEKNIGGDVWTDLKCYAWLFLGPLSHFFLFVHTIVKYACPEEMMDTTMAATGSIAIASASILSSGFGIPFLLCLVAQWACRVQMSPKI